MSKNRDHRKMGEGNTKTSPIKKKKDDIQVNQLKYWFFTFNNYDPKKDIEILNRKFREICSKFCFQEEKGKDGTKHLQGQIELKKAGRWTEFGLPKQIHWEKTKCRKAAWEYCCKEDTRNGEVYKYGFPAEVKVIKDLRPWQKQIEDYILGDINDRKILWIYDEVGNVGKTQLTKYLIVKHKVICATSGGNKDIANLLKNQVEAGTDLNEKNTFIFSFGRSTEGISYKAIESVKDGLITNTKYEAGTIVFNCPHVIVFSNELPEIKKLSKDRWDIRKIDKNLNLVEVNKKHF